MIDEIRSHCAEINRCNQRGGRMLSVVDLIDADTITPELAAYSLAAIGGGASFLVGALPGGAGKTTVMGALLNFVPRSIRLAPADGMATIERARAQTQPGCYICHEISNAAYYAYLWGASLRAYFGLADAGHMLATNLHADTYEQARDQICADNGVSETALWNVKLMFFLSVGGGWRRPRRRIERVWESDGQGDHRLVFDADSSSTAIDSTRLVSPDDVERARRTIDQLVADGVHTIEETRAMILRVDEGSA